MTENHDTITAIATPPGKGGVGIIRVSGPNARVVSKTLLKKDLIPRSATYAAFHDLDGDTIDMGIALFFKAPHSFTGEDIIEFQGHGGPFILDRILKTILQLEVRIAAPGEFTQRAFLNGKIDLTQAEAIADLIHASSTQAAKAALRSLQGDFSKEIENFLADLTQFRVYIEASIDFPDEAIDFISENQVKMQLNYLQTQLKKILDTAQQGVLLKEGLTVVLCGKPNSGKSTLLNALSKKEHAIVTDLPGTTRDLMQIDINLGNLVLHIIDTAGLRNSTDHIEQEGIKRAWQAIETADLALWVKALDVPSKEDPFYAALKARCPQLKCVTILNKIDLDPTYIDPQHSDILRISAKDRIGLEALEQYLKKEVGFKQNIEGQFIARRRHLEALNAVQKSLNTAIKHLLQHQAAELAAEECRIAQKALASITGAFSSEDLLGEIFSNFCLGK